MFKKIFNPKQNHDPTLHEKGYGVYRAGRISAFLILVLGTLLALGLATWLGNFIQELMMLFLDSHVGIFSFNFPRVGSNFTQSVFSLNAVFHNEYLIGRLSFFNCMFFINHGKMIASIIRIVLFFAIAPFISWKGAMDLFVKYRNLNHGEYGSSKIATPQDVARETNRIPDRAYTYDIPSGVIMMHKFNLKGKINKVVKQQLMSLKKYFQLDKAHDPSGNQFIRFYATVKCITLTILVLLGIGGFCGFFKYNFGNGHAGVFWPFYFWLILWDLIHFIVKGFFDFIVDLGDLEIHMFMLPWFTWSLILIVELAVCGVLFYQLLEQLHSSLAYNTDGSYLHLANDNVIHNYFTNVHRHHKKELHHLHDQIEEFKNPSMVDTELQSNEQGQKRIPIMDHKHPRMYLIHLWMQPVEHEFLHGKHPFYKKPILALKMALLQFLNNVCHLDTGITGWYYLTGGNGAMQNVLIYGITRSGKGQMIVNTIVDINSRASHRYQKNMIFNDSKGELAASTYKILKKRGYDVKVLNIMDMSHSMSYNPLALVIKQARAGSIGVASKACSQLSYTIYNPQGQGQNSFFYTEAASLFDSIVFAQLALAHSRYYGLDDFKTYHGKNVHDDGKNHTKHKYYIDSDGVVHSHEDAWSRITINNTLQMTVQLGGETAQQQGNELDESNELMIYFMHLAHRLNKLRSRKKANPASMTEVWDDQLSILNQAVSEFQNSKMAGGKTAGSIYSTFLDRLKIYQQPSVSKMTSMNNYDSEEMGFDRLFTIQFSRHFGQQNITTKLFGEKITKNTDANGNIVKRSHLDPKKLIETSNSHLNGVGLAKVPFNEAINYSTFYVQIVIHDERISKNFTFVIKCHKHYYDSAEYKKINADYHQRPRVADLEIINKGTDKERVIDRYTKKPALEKIDLNVVKEPTSVDYSSNNSSLNRLAENPHHVVRQMHFLYNPRPTALFLVTPPNATELNQLCTFLINQTFNTLSTMSLKIAKGRHIQRPLQFILDELGNIPAIPNMSKKVSIGLSQHIEFMVVFQNKEQILKNYGKTEGPSIISNCSTTYYILSKSADTIKSVSDAFGKRTVQATGLNQDPTNVNSANYNHNLMAQPVMSQARLRHLEPGEIAILRTNDRSTVWGKSEKPWPIFDTGNYVLPYSFTFLKKFESSDSLNSLPVVTPHKYLDLEKVTVQFSQVYRWLEEKEPLDEAYVRDTATNISNEIDSCPLPKTFKVSLSNILEAAIESKDPKTILEKASHIHVLIKRYTQLLKSHTIKDLAQFALAVITQSGNNVDVLHDINPPHPGNYLFNFMNHDAKVLIQYFKNIRTKFEAIADPQTIKASAPFLYGSNKVLLMHGLVDLIENHKPKASMKKVITGNRSQLQDELNESFILNQLNTVSNLYLAGMHLITVDDDGTNHLTTDGKQIIDDASIIVNGFFKQNGAKFNYAPDVPMSKVIISIMNDLKWVSKHPKFNHYYGLAFVFNLLSLQHYKDFCYYTDSNGQKQSLALSPMSYLMGILSVFDAICLHPDIKRNKDKHKAPFKLSKPYYQYLDNLGNQDVAVKTSFVTK